jgi:membrane-associated phospholipid phosphatase
LDDAARELFRPDDRWGELQIRVDYVVEGLKPPVTLALLLVAGLAISAARRSRRGGLLVVGLVVGTVIVTRVLQALVGRADTHGEVADLGGSFPSGHTVALMVCVGGLFIASTGRLRPSACAWCAVAAAAMGLSLLVQAAHWLTDVVGGILLGVVILSVASALAGREGGHTPSWGSSARTERAPPGSHAS